MNKFSNISEYTVSQVNKAIKNIIEGNFNVIKVIGELSQVKRHSSGHIYFTLKDQDSTLSGVCWRSSRGSSWAAASGTPSICTDMVARLIPSVPDSGRPSRRRVRSISVSNSVRPISIVNTRHTANNAMRNLDIS